MILVRLDPHQRATALMSLPRDLVVDIPGHGRQKLNAAFAYGEDRLTLRTVRNLLKIPIHHYVRVTFWGFRGAVDRLGCVYVDVDHKYFNDNSPPNGGGGPYAVIDVGAGYQRLCGAGRAGLRALPPPRQRPHPRRAPAVVPGRGQEPDRHRQRLLRPQGAAAHLRAVGAHRHRLAATRSSRCCGWWPSRPTSRSRRSSSPPQDAGDGSGNVVIGDKALQQHGRELPGRARDEGPARRGEVHDGQAQQAQAPPPADRRSPGLIRNRDASENIAAPLQVKLGRLPVYYPTLMSATGSYRVDDSRAYDIVDRAGKRHRAYRIVAYEGRIGQYYGIQGTDWRSPPILDNPSSSVTSGGRTFKLFYDGSRLKLVAWRTRRGSYWVSNTLLRTLTNKQMLALARSARTLGGR